ncbi:Gfo/Idh/MocA family protein [Anatilimnocola sp. NA78]|uniref:Gfo/Idh/MocA family protein n=1 Tax=Anatilimnocola sp. NA78 TaxID=3415683 RepID=UPI003CE4ED39
MPDANSPEQHALDRRQFLQAVGSVAGTAAIAAALPQVSSAAKGPNEKLTVGVMGVNGRGSALTKSFLSAGAHISYICDVDERAIAKAAAIVGDQQQIKPQGVSDFRKILDDKTVDILICAAPNHWHAPATILGCAAGKHVYVEKPCSHNPREGELAVEASRKHNRVVQMGSQRRSWPGIVEAVDKIKKGEIGKVHYARAWYNNKRPNIKHGQPAEVPSWLDWTLWQGPAPEKAFKDNLLHYNWHWHWHYGNGELGNNGIHALDVCRWGLDVEFPNRVTSGGGKYRHDDDQETPDTHIVTYNFPGNKSIMWEGLSWSPLGSMLNQFGCSFHGENGSIVIIDPGYKQYDDRNKEVGASPAGSRGGDPDHVNNFLECVRTGKRPNADIEEGHKSTLMCHLGNIAHRVNRVITTDEKNGHIVGDDQAMNLWSREYRPGWEPKV